MERHVADAPQGGTPDFAATTEDLTKLAGDLGDMSDHLDKQVTRMDAIVDRIEAGWRGPAGSTHDSYPTSRTWGDLDPIVHPFDPDTALDVVREVVSSPDPQSRRPRGLWSAQSVAGGLAQRYGAWAFWWAGAVDESPESGAVIQDLPAGSDDVEQQARRYTSALLQWRAWLEELAAAFESLAPASEADENEIRRARARAVAPLVTLVIERTGAGETWLATCSDVFAWFLESTGMSPVEAEDLADDVVDSEFDSWIAPEAEAVRRVREAIGEHGA